MQAYKRKRSKGALTPEEIRKCFEECGTSPRGDPECWSKCLRAQWSE